MGGVKRLDQIVAPLPGVLLLRDHDGVHWDVKTRTALASTTLETRKRELAEAAATEREAAREIAREGWSVRRSGSGAPNVALDSVKTARGNLDLARALDATLAGVPADTIKLVARDAVQEELASTAQNRQGLWTNQTENCKSWWFFGWHSSCDAVEIGEIGEPATNQAHTPWQSRGHSMDMCFPFKDPETNGSLGCGPAAITSLVWADWRRGGVFSSLAGLDRTKVGSYLKIDASYQTFTKTIGQPLVEAMGTCSFGEDGSMTTPAGLRNGGNAWLQANGSSKRVKMLGGIAGLGAGLDQYAVALHERVGLRSQPTIAGFDLGFVSSHWSPIYRYRIVRPAGVGRLQVYIQSLDFKDRWYSLGGIKLLSALAWLE